MTAASANATRARATDPLTSPATWRATWRAEPRVMLGVETTCDETAAAVVRWRPEAADGPGDILSNVVWGQAALHARFGGVVPEIAARAHAERVDHCVRAAIAESGVAWDDLDGVSVAAGPGLIGGVSSGVVAAKSLAMARGLPIWGVNHLEGHALSPRLSDGIETPYLLLLVSGGHCQLLAVAEPTRYHRLGASIDDAPGEAFDKIAKHLGIAFPGGPEVEKAASRGDAARFDLPRPLANRTTADMSFSGLKTAARLAADALVAKQGGLTDGDVEDLCASFQAAVADSLAQKTAIAAAAFERVVGEPFKALAVAGGVAANARIRGALAAVAAERSAAFAAPPPAICTDNGAMIAWAALERARRGPPLGQEAISARARWPLDERASPLLGSGKRGPKQ